MSRAGRKHREPSRASLRAMPVIDIDPKRFMPNTYANRIAIEGSILKGNHEPHTQSRKTR